MFQRLLKKLNYKVTACQVSVFRGITEYSFRMWENADSNNPEYGHFLRSDC